MKDFIYLDYNATTPIDKEVVKAMEPYLQENFGNASSSYQIGIAAKDALEKARARVAALLNASADEIVFTSGGTEANNMAILGSAYANEYKGKHIITSLIEHPAVINVCKHLEAQGWEVSYLPVDHNGRVLPDDVEKAIRPDTVLVTIMHANNEVGTIQAIQEIGAIAARHNIAFHTDAAQSLGKLNIDVQELGVDLLSIAGHKLYAPKGVGALYVRQGTQLQNIVWGASQEAGLRPGTENVPYIVGLGKACELAAVGLKGKAEHLQTMKKHLLQGLQLYLSDIVVHGIADNCLPNTLSLSIKGVQAFQLAAELGDKVGISTGSACHANAVHVSSVLKAMQVSESQALSTVRLSVGKYTTAQEIDKAVVLISDAVKKLY